MKHTIIKLGGSVITNKTIEGELRPEVLADLIAVLNDYKPKSDEKIWCFHGGGSFAHFAAKRWKETNDDQYFQQAKDGMDTLNTIIRESLNMEYEVVPARKFWNDPEAQWQHSVQNSNLFLGHGDAVDTGRQKLIVSTEDQVGSLVKFLGKAPIRILYLGDTPGVLDAQSQVIPVLNSDNLPTFFENDTADVTGGMQAKIQQSLDMLQDHTEITLTSGFEAQNLEDWLREKPIIGTKLKN